MRGHRWRSRTDAALALVGEGPGELLEIGMGSGRRLSALPQQGWTVSAIDASPSMVKFVRERVPVAAERITVDRAEALPFRDACFDLVVAIGVLEFTDVHRAARELARVLRPDGRAVLGLRNGRAPASAWRDRVIDPLARALKNVVPFGRPLGSMQAPPLSLSGTHDLQHSAGLAVEHVENCGCAVLPDPLDHLAPGLAYAAARTAERWSLLRSILGTERLVVARREPATLPRGAGARRHDG